VIEIVDDRNIYLALLGIDWAIDMNRMINLKKRTMSFEIKFLHVVVPLDLAKGLRYTEWSVIMKVMMIWTKFIR